VEPTRTLVPELLRELGLDSGVAGWRAVEAWPAIVGERLARRTRAASFHQGTLRVEVVGSSWASELEFLKRHLLRELQQRLGPHVRELRFLVTARRGSQR
jgi:predicted nucleic acid-binding Zn ribbon protein